MHAIARSWSVRRLLDWDYLRNWICFNLISFLALPLREAVSNLQPRARYDLPEKLEDISSWDSNTDFCCSTAHRHDVCVVNVATTGCCYWADSPHLAGNCPHNFQQSLFPAIFHSLPCKPLAEVCWVLVVSYDSFPASSGITGRYFRGASHAPSFTRTCAVPRALSRKQNLSSTVWCKSLYSPKRSTW